MSNETITNPDYLALTGDWLRTIFETGDVPEIEPEIIRAALTQCGANFDTLDQVSALRESLGKRRVDAREEALRAIWGEETYANYRQFVSTWISYFEQKMEVDLPQMAISGRKDKGFMQFLGHLTAYAAQTLSYDDFQRYTQARIENARRWLGGERKEFIRLRATQEDELYKPASMPKEFIPAFWHYLKAFN